MFGTSVADFNPKAISTPMWRPRHLKPQAFVSYYESGARRLDLLELRQVCKVLGVPLVQFVRRFEKALQ